MNSIFLSPSPTFSIVPLSYDSSLQQIHDFLSQISALSVPLDLIVVLEPSDRAGYSYWYSALQNHFVDYPYFLTTTDVCNSSKGGCLNKAISLSSCDYIVRADMDDVIYPDRLFNFLSFIGEAMFLPDLVYTDMINSRTGKLMKYPSPGMLSLWSIFRNPIPAPTVIFRRSFFNKIGFVYPNFNRCEDLALAIAFIDSSAQIVKLPKPSVCYSGVNIFRDRFNWKYNSIVRFCRPRGDIIGCLSKLFGVFLGAVYFLCARFACIVVAWDNRTKG